MAHPPLNRVLHYVRRLAGQAEGGAASDSQLLRQFVASRDETAFADLLQRHGPFVLGVCRQVLGDLHAAEDAFQATFLVLARKAGSIRRGEALGPWLYRVAVNLARTARTQAAQRRVHERQAAALSPAISPNEFPLADWQPVLHEEVNRLPEKYRVPVVLCYLEGQSNEEAARKLGWPVGTVKGRLARARELMRTRLVRRGLTLSTAGFAALLSAGAAPAAVSPVLIQSTLQAAVWFAAGQTAGAGIAATPALALAQGALKSMALTRLTLVAWFVLLVGALGGGGSLLAVSTRGEEKLGDRFSWQPNLPLAAARPKPVVVAVALPRPRPNKDRPRGGQAVKGLQLILAAPGPAGVGMMPDGSNIWSFKLHFIYKNVSGRPLKLYMSPLPSQFWTFLDVKGPNSRSIRVEDMAKEFKVRAPTAEDFCVLKPGEARTRIVNFPMDEIGERHFYLLEPGKYRLKATYDLARPLDSPFAEGSWTGKVVSNELTVEVHTNRGDADGYGPVRGLRAKISLTKKKFGVGESVNVAYTVKNVSKVEQTLWHSGFWPDHLIMVRNGKGKEAPLTALGRQCRKAFAPAGERGKNVPVRVQAGGEDATEGQYDLTKLYDLSRPDRYTVQYVYEEEHKGGWQGRLESNVVAFEVAARKGKIAQGKKE